MKLRRIKIINFGQLSHLTFDLPSEKLDVFFGANEAGKSTTVAFIKQVLFGFYLRSSKSPFFEDYRPLAQVSPMGGSLFFVDDDSNEYELERLWATGDKQSGVLTVKLNQQIVPEKVFFDQIKNIDGNFYTDSFIFNQDMLGQVAKLSQNDLLEQIYYLGAAESNKLLLIRDNFDKKADELFKKNGRKPEVNRLINEVKAQRQQLDQVSDEFKLYQEYGQQKQVEQKQLLSEQDKLSELQKQLEKQTELQKQLNNYYKMQDLEKQIKNVDFDTQNYQQAQLLQAKIENLQNQADSMHTNETEIPRLNELKAEDIINQKAQILQEKSEIKQKQAAKHQLELELETLANYNEAVPMFAQFSPAEVAEVKKDYAALPKLPNVSATPSPTINMPIMVGVFALAIILFFINHMLGLAVIAVLAIVGGFIYNQKSKSQKQKKLEQVQLREYQDQLSAFQEKYRVNPKAIDLAMLLQEAGEYRLKATAEADTEAEIVQLRMNAEQYASQLSNLLNANVSANYDNIVSALNKLATQIQLLKDKKYKIEQVNEQKLQLNRQIDQSQLQLKAIFAKAGVNNFEQYQQQYQGSLHQAEMKAQLAALKNSLEADLPELKQLAEMPKSGKNTELSNQVLVIKERISDLTNKIAKLTVKQEQLADSDILFENKQKLSELESQLADDSAEYISNLLAGQIITRTLDIASNERFPKMLVAAKEYFRLLTGNRYTDIILDNKLSVIRYDGKRRELKYLSRGTAEQLYFALKLAFVGEIQDQINLPILIDDSFVNFDVSRIKHIKELLLKMTEHNQVIVFTAQEGLANNLTSHIIRFTQEE